jgi:acetylornithine deacetylase/succinyl-diaminopimelate desuccinylase-like protein
MWGGPVLDAATALARLLARLVDDRGQLAVPGIEDDVPVLSSSERAALQALPFDAQAFRSDAGMLASSALGGDPKLGVYERLWLRPAIAVTALEAVPLATASNQLIDEARARVGIRVAPGQDPERVRELVMEQLAADPPWGVAVELQADTSVPGWRISAQGPAFDAARRALQAGFERAPVDIGCGGTIPFVGPFSQVMGDAPALLLGLEDPVCNAHGENESLCLEDFRKAARAAACLLEELATPDTLRAT